MPCPFCEPVAYCKCTTYKRNCIKCLFKRENNASGYMHLFFCPKRIKAIKIFNPRIDNVIFPRFFQMLQIDEQFALVLKKPTIENFIKLEPIYVLPSIDENSAQYLNKTNIIINNYFPYTDSYAQHVDSLPLASAERTTARNLLAQIFSSIKSKTFVCKAKYIDVSSKIVRFYDLHHLLSTDTIKLIYRYGFFGRFNLKQIIMAAPNISYLVCDEYMKPNCFEVLMQYSRCKAFQWLHLAFQMQSIDPKELIKFLKKKTDKDSHVHIKFSTNSFSDENAGKKMKDLRSFKAIVAKTYATRKYLRNNKGLLIGKQFESEKKCAKYTLDLKKSSENPKKKKKNLVK